LWASFAFSDADSQLNQRSHLQCPKKIHDGTTQAEEEIEGHEEMEEEEEEGEEEGEEEETSPETVFLNF
jgi:hypothetical protein